MSDLSSKSCIPCRGGVPSLSASEIDRLLKQVAGWSISEKGHLTKTFTFPDFISALAFTNRAGAIAEEQAHHPDLHLTWGKVGVEIWTHKINGLTESDFVLAAKIDKIA